MLELKKSAPGNSTRSRTALSLVAATLLLGGGISEASAKSHRHHHRHHHGHHAANASWRDANASVGSGSGHSFSGMASYYGNESGSRTASGQRFNQSAMTCAHRSLPFGTKLKVTHGGRSVVVTVNDRGPFIRGRVLDLSTGAARAVGLTGAGVGRVTAEVVS
jgi:rare lipoprotein A